MRFYFKYIAGLPETSVSASLVLGSALHRSLQFHFEQLLAGQPAPDIDTLLGVFQEAWQENEGRDVRFNKGDDINSIGRLAEKLLQHFQQSSFARPAGTIIGVEEQLRGVLIPGVPELLARIDLLVETEDAMVLSDFKSARSAWSEEHVADAAGQLLLYSELAKKLTDGKPLRLSFAVLTKGKFPELMIHPVPRDPQQIARTKRIIERAWRGIEAGIFLPQPSPIQCPTCSYRQQCRGWTG